MMMSMIMKKKKQRDELMIVQGGLIFFHRGRRQGIYHLLPLLSAISACSLLLLFALYPITPTTNHHRPSSTLQTLVLHMNYVHKENVFRVPMSGGILGRDLWTSNRSNFFHGCSNATTNFPKMNRQGNSSSRYLLIATSGGLNQQRTGITDAVVAAYILNATLVVPKLDQKSFWKDPSNFSDIFDVNWFINYLSKDVKIIEQLPENAGKVINTRAPRKCNQNCYQTRILPIFNRKHVQAVRLTKFDYRLSNRLDVDLQKLRCRVNYHALRFTNPILDMSSKLVQRMRTKSKKYIALHLRFEPDMLAFSGCYYGGGEKEIKELGAIRKRWRTLHTKNPDKERRQGKCPLSPEEVGLMLRALGYGKDVHIYVASGEIYGGEETLAPLKTLFPNLHTKESIATKEELSQFSSYSSRMAALDFIVCDESDVFVANNNGNMAKILAGRRRYFGHKPTIRPNAKKLYRLFFNRENMTWDEFGSGVRTFQIGFMGEPNEVRAGRGEFHEHPLTCICQEETTFHKSRGGGGGGGDQVLAYEDEQDLSETEYVEDVTGIQEYSNTKDLLQPELEELFSD